MFKVKEILKATNGDLLQGRELLTVKGICRDSRAIKPGELFIALKGFNHNGHDFIKDAIKRRARVIVVSEKREYPKNITVILVSDTIKAFQDMAIFHRNKFKTPLIAIVGSNGKTTTKDMITNVLSKRYKILSTEGTENNRIGVALTLLQLEKKHQVIVLELGTNHFGEILNLSRISRPDIAIFTNIGKSHLEFLKDLPSVFKEKYSAVQYLNPKGSIIFNKDDYHLKKIERNSKRKFKLVTYSVKSKSFFRATKINLGFDHLDFLLNNEFWIRLNTPAEHNVYNALAAIACARNFNMSWKEIIKGLETFKPSSMRFNFNRIKDFYLINDCYNSNPLSLGKAIEVLSRYDCGKKILVCGDMLELGKLSKKLHFDAGKKVGENGIDILITVGKLSRWIAKGARKTSFNKKRILSFESSDQVAGKLKKMIEPGDVVLVKGSRSIAMERVAEDLKKHY